MITDQQYNKWLKLSIVICNNKQTAKDVLHELLITIIENDIEKEKLNDNYIFISLRNRYLKHINSEKKYNGNTVLINNDSEQIFSNLKDIDVNELDTNNNDYIDHYLVASQHTSKLKSIESVVMTLREYDQNLYKLHFIYKISQRKISRETGITLRSINNSINKIKIKIKKHHYEKKD
jgi:DNA-directed RNA polymerase specialized sigma24 family protein